MTTPTPEYLANNFALACSRLLELAVAFVEEADSTGDESGLRSYVSAGIPAWDLSSCGQIVLYPTIVSPGYPGYGQGGRSDPGPNIGRTYGLTLELARCQPNADGDVSPSVEDLNDAGARMLRDYRILDLFVASVGFNSKIRDAALRLCGVQSIAPGVVSAVQPQGGMAAVRVSFQIVV